MREISVEFAVELSDLTASRKPKEKKQNSIVHNVQHHTKLSHPGP